MCHHDALRFSMTGKSKAVAIMIIDSELSLVHGMEDLK